MRQAREDSLPWYKQFWPWFLISLPLSVVIAAIVTISIAIKTNDGLVSDDYYRDGLAIHKDAARIARARALGIIAELEFELKTGTIRVGLSRPPPEGSQSLVLRVVHPTLPRQDQEIAIARLGNRTYGGRLKPLGPAHWKLQLYPANKTWRIEGRLKLPGQTYTQLD